MHNLNQSSSQMKGDSHLSAHHVTIVTDAGGLAFIRPAEGNEVIRVDLRNSRKKESLCATH